MIKTAAASAVLSSIVFMHAHWHVPMHQPNSSAKLLPFARKVGRDNPAEISNWHHCQISFSISMSPCPTQSTQYSRFFSQLNDDIYETSWQTPTSSSRGFTSGVKTRLVSQQHEDFKQKTPLHFQVPCLFTDTSNQFN